MPAIKKSARYASAEAEVIRRLELAMQARGLSRLELGRRLEALTGWEGSSAVNQWFIRKVLPSGLVTASLYLAVEVAPEWLYFGQGAMESSELDVPQLAWARGMAYATARMQERTAELQQEAMKAEATAPGGVVGRTLAAAHLALPPLPDASGQLRQRRGRRRGA